MAIRDEVLPVGPPVTLEWQIGRTRDIEEVRLAAMGGEDIVLFDVRRTGKTTVALGALELLVNAGHLVFALDATENAPTTVDLAERLVRQLASHRTALSNASASALKSVRVIHEIGTGATDLIEDETLRAAVSEALSRIRPTASGTQKLDAVLSDIGVEAQRRGCRAVVLIDEAQAIADWDDAEELQAMLRSRLRGRDNTPSFVFAGSEPTAMETLFTRDGMLAFHGIKHQLHPISEADWHTGLSRAFAALRCDISERAIAEILAESQGQALRTMLVARETHRVVQTSADPHTADVGHVVAGALAASRQPLWRIDEVAL